MSEIDFESEKYEKHREAGEILAQVREEAAERVEVGKTHLEIAEWAEERTRELGGEPAFPVNISVDEEAAHASPGADDETTFGEELVNLDLGVHVDGWLADTAVTVDLSGHDDLAEIPEEALEAALELVEDGVETGEIGERIEEIIENAGFNPVVNLTGHGLAQWEQHTPPNIPNRSVSQSSTLSAGDVVAIEPFATDGTGKVGEGNKVEIYGLDREGSVRNNDAREALSQITERYRTLPFAARWLDVERPEMALRRLERQNIVHSYPVLKEDTGTLVSQAEHTVIVTEDGCEITTER